MNSQQEESLRSKNAELEKQLAEKELELKRRNHDLEIEASLERVRTVAMGMRKTDDLLSICQILFEELTALGFIELRNAMINIVNDEKGSFLNYDFQIDADPTVTHFLYNSHPVIERQVNITRSASDAFIEHILTGDDLEDFKVFRVRNGELPDPKLENISSLYYYFYSIGIGSVGISTFSSLTEEKRDVLKRFRNVFDLAYRRYADIQLAEAQAREAQIQLALERVRARTMAMQKSEELTETAFILFQQFKELGKDPIQITIGIINEEKRVIEFNITNFEEVGAKVDNAYNVAIEATALMREVYAAWKEQKKSIVIELTGPDLNEWINYRNSLRGVVDETDYSGERRSVCAGFFSSGLITFSSAETPSQESISILERFAGVFEQTYTRFLDLKKAEAQARESQIELALERVRARTMAMQRSDELAETVFILFQQFKELGENPDQATIGIINEEEHVIEYWVTMYGSQINKVFKFPIDEPIVTHKIYKAWKAKKTSLVIDLTGKELHTFTMYRESMGGAKFNKAEKRRVINVAFFSKGLINVQSSEERSAESLRLLERFAGVFDGTYTRFLDLQKAEGQAREAQIELSLERVRAKTMAMHNSNDVGDTLAAMFDELVKLGVETLRCGILINADRDKMEVWTASSAQNGGVSMIIGRLDMNIHPLLKGIYNAWAEKRSFFTSDLDGEDMINYYTAINSLPDYPVRFDIEALPRKQVHSDFFFTEGAIFAFTTDPIPAPSVQIFKRFAGVFGQTYRRYLDLRRAEVQARESQIQLALERVRARTMAMQKSEELAETSVEVFKQLISLGIQPNRLFIGIIKDNSGDIELWATEEDGSKISTKFTGNMNQNLSIKKMYAGWKAHKKSITIDMKGKELQEYFRYLAEDLKVPFKLGRSQKRRVQSIAYFSQGFIGMASPEPQPEETTILLERFAGVFNLTYTRFNDLQKAEAQAREAIKQASVDRVRGEIASMRSTADLGRITPLIWNELTILGIPFIRCGVFIMDEQEQLIHTHLSTADGKALATFNLPFDSEGIGQNVLPAWRQKQIATIHWSKEEFATYTKNLVSQGTVKSKERYVTEHPDTSLDLHFLPFLQGMLYAGNTSPLTADEMNLVQSLADAFSTAYARYDDFNKLEAAKQQVENTLTDLKAAQTKLIQSEKMASLGELTAGIAHEIQNPLNFVNNFSEVNQEMIDELEDELRSGNIDEALAIAADIKQNEQKINHHGKRADGIVKGMLQHSRSGGGEKQLTNINVLADEFLRLSYHGLRAKDKTFNAEMIAHFDPDLPKINVLAQDMGRVLLNLFNNAFYAVNQKQKTVVADYKPEVSVSTSTANDQVVIRVKDNGVGIPDAIKEKIMQPFFTTKPTGEGTGLGLSLTYDMVVKRHGGSIQVNSVEGEGSEFIILLPLITTI